METTPRAPNSTVEDIGTLLHKKKKKLEGKKIIFFECRCFEGMFLAQSQKHILDSQPEAFVRLTHRASVYPDFDWPFRGDAQPQRVAHTETWHSETHGRVHMDYTERKWLSGWSVWAAVAASS